VAYGKMLEPTEKEAAKERQGQRTDLVPNRHDVEFGKTRDKVAAAVGMGRDAYAKAKAVVEAAEAEPEKYSGLVEKMDETGNVNVPYRKLSRHLVVMRIAP